MKLLAKYCLLLIIVVANIKAQHYKVEFKPTDILYKLNYPVKVAILQFSGKGAFEKDLFVELCQNKYIRKQFEINPFESLNKIKNIFGIKDLDPDDKTVLMKLNKNLGVEIVIAGTVSDIGTELIIKRAEDGEELFHITYRVSTNSSILKDIMMLFVENKIPEYIILHEIKFIITPDTAELIVDSINYKQMREIYLETGFHHVYVKKDGYNELKINIEVSKDKNMEYTLVLKQIYAVLFTIRPEVAFLMIDNVLYGVERRVMLEQGLHDVIIKKDGYKRLYKSIEVKLGGANSFPFELEKEYEVTFNIIPSTADLIIDEIQYNQKREIKLTSGTHRIVLKKDGFMETVTDKYVGTFAHQLIKIIMETEMIKVKGGEFYMGNNRNNKHKVSLQSFEVDKYEVTQEQYEAVMGTNPSYHKDPKAPVENVSWYEANEYAGKVGKRLLTEAEWEYTAKGGIKGIESGNLYSGNNEIFPVGWYKANSDGITHPVGKKEANELNICDMTGNVWEWCNDWYDESYYKWGEDKNPIGPLTGKERVIRGGSWNSKSTYCSVFYRNGSNPDLIYNDVGFRCARNVE